MDQPSPMTSSVTPWRISLCEAPSSINDSLRPAHHVDESGGDREAVGLDHVMGGDATDIADRGDPVAPDRDVTDLRRPAAAVVDRSAPNDQIDVAHATVDQENSWNRRRSMSLNAAHRPPPRYALVSETTPTPRSGRKNIRVLSP